MFSQSLIIKQWANNTDEKQCLEVLHPALLQVKDKAAMERQREGKVESEFGVCDILKWKWGSAVSAKLIHSSVQWRRWMPHSSVHTEWPLWWDEGWRLASIIKHYNLSHRGALCETAQRFLFLSPTPSLGPAPSLPGTLYPHHLLKLYSTIFWRYLLRLLSVSVRLLTLFSMLSSLCGSSFRNLTASTSTRSTARILVCKAGNSPEEKQTFAVYYFDLFQLHPTFFFTSHIHRKTSRLSWCSVQLTALRIFSLSLSSHLWARPEILQPSSESQRPPPHPSGWLLSELLLSLSAETLRTVPDHCRHKYNAQWKAEIIESWEHQLWWKEITPDSELCRCKNAFYRPFVSVVMILSS